MTISVTDIANEMTASADTTLSGLTLSEGRLSPVFPSGTTAYTASVGYTVLRITVTATTTDSGATVTFLDGNDAALADADGVTNGHQVDLEVGANVIKVKVTAEDGDTTRTYTVTVTREATVNICNRTRGSADGDTGHDRGQRQRLRARTGQRAGANHQPANQRRVAHIVAGR